MVMLSEKTMSKMTTYRIIAKAPKKGREIPCSLCGKAYKCNPDDKTPEIICGYCIMGLVDGLPEHLKRVVKTRYKRLK